MPYVGLIHAFNFHINRRAATIHLRSHPSFRDRLIHYCCSGVLSDFLHCFNYSGLLLSNALLLETFFPKDAAARVSLRWLFCPLAALYPYRIRIVVMYHLIVT